MQVYINTCMYAPCTFVVLHDVQHHTCTQVYISTCMYAPCTFVVFHNVHPHEWGEILLAKVSDKFQHQLVVSARVCTYQLPYNFQLNWNTPSQNDKQTDECQSIKKVKWYHFLCVGGQEGGFGGGTFWAWGPKFTCQGFYLCTLLPTLLNVWALCNWEQKMVIWEQKMVVLCMHPPAHTAKCLGPV